MAKLLMVTTGAGTLFLSKQHIFLSILQNIVTTVISIIVIFVFIQTTRRQSSRRSLRRPSLVLPARRASVHQGSDSTETLRRGSDGIVEGDAEMFVCCPKMIIYPDDPCMVYLATSLGHLWGFDVGKYTIHESSGIPSVPEHA